MTMTHPNEAEPTQQQQQEAIPAAQAPPFASSIENVLHANQCQIEQQRTLIETNYPLSLKEKVQMWSQLAKSNKEENLDALEQEIQHLKESLHSMHIEQNRLKHELHLATQPSTSLQEKSDGGKKEEKENEPPRELPKLQFYIRRVEELSMEASKWETLFYDAAEIGERQIERLEQRVQDLQDKLESPDPSSKTASSQEPGEKQTTPNETRFTTSSIAIQELQKKVQGKDELIKELQAQIKSLQSDAVMSESSPVAKKERDGNEEILLPSPVTIGHSICKNESASSTQNTSLDDEDLSFEPQDDSLGEAHHAEIDALGYVRELEVQFLTRKPQQKEEKNEEVGNEKDPPFEEECVDEENVDVGSRGSCSTHTPAEQNENKEDGEDFFVNEEVQQMILDLEEETEHLQEALKASQERVWDLERQLRASQQEVRNLQKHQQEQQYITSQIEKKKDISWEIDRKSLEKLVILQKRALLDVQATLESARLQSSEKEGLPEQQQMTSPEKGTKWRFSFLRSTQTQPVNPEEDSEQKEEHDGAQPPVNEHVTAALLLRNNLDVEKALRQSVELEMAKVESQLAETQQTLENLQEELEKERSSHATEMTQLQEEITCLRGSNEYHKESLEVLKEALREVSLELAASRKVDHNEEESNDK